MLGFGELREGLSLLLDCFLRRDRHSQGLNQNSEARTIIRLRKEREGRSEGRRCLSEKDALALGEEAEGLVGVDGVPVPSAAALGAGAAGAAAALLLLLLGARLQQRSSATPRPQEPDALAGAGAGGGRAGGGEGGEGGRQDDEAGRRGGGHGHASLPASLL